MNGLDFDRQRVIGNYIVDFYYSSQQTVIEVDGSSHANKVEYDQERERYLTSLGLQIIHIAAKDILQHMANVMQFLHQHPWLQTDGQTP